jgi:hypothetical protein
MNHPAEPPTGTTALFCHPSTGAPENAWYRDDQGATEGGYGDQHRPANPNTTSPTGTRWPGR